RNKAFEEGTQLGDYFLDCQIKFAQDAKFFTVSITKAGNHRANRLIRKIIEFYPLFWLPTLFVLVLSIAVFIVTPLRVRV
ncbi:MAG: hypothetical protein MI861_26500, partial [Pirellulales bacterium]|nr:hypothetical protein [Pirellulales bacterium]